MEAADTSLRYDRRVRIPLYGASGIPEAWLVDVEARTLEVSTDPGPEGYRRVVTLGPGDRVASGAFPDLVLEIEAVLA